MSNVEEKKSNKDSIHSIVQLSGMSKNQIALLANKYIETQETIKLQLLMQNLIKINDKSILQFVINKWKDKESKDTLIIKAVKKNNETMVKALLSVNVGYCLIYLFLYFFFFCKKCCEIA